MPPATVHRPPQTLKQAKKAFQKAGKAPRISAVEQRRLERAAELRERAEAIEKREKNKKANAKKKAEKEERERKKRKRMGIPEPVNEGYISPRQVRMGVYLGKRKREGVEGEAGDEVREGVAKKTKEGVEIAPKSPAARYSPSGRNPLRDRSTNVTLRSQSYKTYTAKQQMTVPEEDWAALVESCSEMEHKDELLQSTPKELLMKSKSPHPKFNRVITRSQSQRVIALEPQGITLDEEWESMLESNSQIERDISTDIDTPLLAPIVTTPISGSPSTLAPCVDDTADLLARISTQDMLGCDELSPLAPVETPEKHSPAMQEGNIMDQDLEELADQYDRCEEAAGDTTFSPAAVGLPVSVPEVEERLRLPDDWEPNLLFPSDEEDFELEEDLEGSGREQPNDNTDEIDVSPRTQPSPPFSPGAPMASPIIRQQSTGPSIHLDYTLSSQDLAEFDNSINDAGITSIRAEPEDQGPITVTSFGTDDFELSTQDLRDLCA